MLTKGPLHLQMCNTTHTLDTWEKTQTYTKTQSQSLIWLKPAALSSAEANTPRKIPLNLACIHWGNICWLNALCMCEVVVLTDIQAPCSPNYPQTIDRSFVWSWAMQSIQRRADINILPGPQLTYGSLSRSLCASVNWKSVRGAPSGKSRLFIILTGHETHGMPKICESNKTRPTFFWTKSAVFCKKGDNLVTKLSEQHSVKMLCHIRPSVQVVHNVM